MAPVALSVLLLLLPCLSHVASEGLVDDPIAGDVVTYLDSAEWTVSSANYPLLRSTVPGDIISDMYANGIIGLPFYELNWQQQQWWGQVWTYNKSFSLTKESILRIESGAEDLLLVFDGVKMPSTVFVNGMEIGITTDQFLRYSFSLSAAHRESGNLLLTSSNEGNLLNVVQDISGRQDSEGRFQASSGGWDWNFYTATFTTGANATGPSPARTFAFGIWKSVYLTSVSSAAITHLVPHVFYTGAYPTSPLTDETTAAFNVVVRTHLWSADPKGGTLTITGGWSSSATISSPVSLPGGDCNVTLNITATPGSFSLWWPNGLGSQPLYPVTASFTPTTSGSGGSSSTLVSTTRKIGFRYAVFVTGNDTDPNWVAANADADGSSNQGLVIRVNGAAIYARGGNMIPIDNLEGHYTVAAYRQLVKSARDSHFNIMRVWGGGIFHPACYYDALDEMGILAYHDAQFAQDSHSPTDGSPTQEAEFRHQIRRLSHHPSIIAIDGCNECHVIIGTPTGVYATFVLNIVVQEDVSRVVWPSCPSAGWQAGVNRLSGHPNGSPLGLLPNARPPISILGKPKQEEDEMYRPYSTQVVNADGNQTCTYQNNTDVSGVDGSSSPGISQEACCALCWATSTCASVVYYEGTCWLKDAGGTPTANPGRVACFTGKVFPKTIEIHGPYQGGNGFPAVNGGETLSIFASGYPLELTQTEISLQVQNQFASEYGAAVFSSFESMAPTLAPEHWSVHGGGPPDICGPGFERVCNGTNVMAQRNYPGDGTAASYFGLEDWDAVGEAAFKRQLWHNMLGQALNVKMKTEMKRGSPCAGTIIWQLGEIYPTGGWGSLEYGTVGFGTTGNVVGGRWKPLQYWLKKSIFTDVWVTCGANGLCVVRNDAPYPLTGAIIVVNKVSLATGVSTNVYNAPLDLPAGAASSMWFTIDSTIDGSQFYLQANVTTTAATEEGGEAGGVYTTLTENTIPLLPPMNWTAALPSNANVTFVVSNTINADGSVDITVSADAMAAFVTFTSLAQGRFSDNAFMMPPGTITLQYIPFITPTDIDTLTSTLRVEHMASYM